MQAQLFSTVGRATSFPSQSHYDYPSSSFRSTSSYPTSYNIPTNAFPTSHKVGNGCIHRTAGRIQSAQGRIQSTQGRIHTAAARLGNGIVSDQMGYIATQPILYNSGDDVLDDDYTTYDNDGTYDDDTYDDETQAPPQFAPLDFDGQVALFMLLLCLAYGIYIRKKGIQPAK